MFFFGKKKKENKKYTLKPITVFFTVVILAVFAVFINFSTIKSVLAIPVTDTATQAAIAKVVAQLEREFGTSAKLTRQQKDAIKDEARERVNRAKQVRDYQLNEALGAAYKNVMLTFAGQMAKDIAVWVANGANGKPLAYIDNWGDYTRKLGENAGADFLATYAQSYGLNICGSPGLKLKITLGLGRINNPNAKTGKIKCTWDQLTKAWDVDDVNFLDNFQAGFSINQNPVGIAVNGISLLQQAKTDKKADGTKERQGNVFKDKIAPITKSVLTPGEFIRKEYEDHATTESINTALVFTRSWMADTVNIFTNTLVQELLKKVKKGHWSLADAKRARSLQDPIGAGSSTTTSAALAAKSASKLATPDLIAVKNFDWVRELSFCPPNRADASIWNCTMDQNFLQVLNTSHDDGSPLSVQQAIDRGLLRGDWPFGWTDPTPTQPSEPDYKGGFPYSSMVRLRRARIIPVGWELAAQKILDLGGGARTLDMVLAGFSEPTSPFFKMVDPEWILRPPVVDCRAQAIGQIAIPQGERQEYCADIRDCISENADGSCNAYGYCQREKNVFWFNGEQCDERNATCQTFIRTFDGAQDNYLESTLTKGNCGIDSAGCQWYGLSQDPDGNWTDSNRAYLTRQAKECGASDSGCTEFIQLAKTDTTRSLSSIVAAVSANASDAYENYGTTNSIYLNGDRISCTEQEVGCNRYTPTIQGNNDIIAVANSADRCPRECVGYDHYTQESTFFDQKQSELFIASTAQECTPEFVGCDEFTNLDALAQGGESIQNFSYIRQCQKPFELDSANTDCAEYITWKGSDIEGYQIEKFVLKATNTTNEAGNNGFGAPATTDGSTDCEDRTSPDCKQFYDSAGNIYYRDFKKTVSCDADCAPYRKTVSSQSDCEGTGGVWTGVCVYQAIPSQAVQCPAVAVGCRAYRGNQSDNTVKIVEDNFEDGDFVGWSAESIGISNESSNLGGRSLRFQEKVNFDLANQMSFGKDYTVELYIKNSLTIPTRFTFKIGSSGSSRTSDLLLGSVDVFRDNWNRHELGNPLAFNRAPLGADESFFIEVTDLSGNPLSQDIFVDNFEIKEVQSALYRIRDSWNTPNSCETDPPLSGGQATSSMIGCKEYKDPAGALHTFKSFGQLCAAEKIGCEAVIHTRNSTAPQQQTFNAGDQSEITVLADSVAYIVNDETKYCSADQKGCRAVGLPALDTDDIVQGYTTVNKLVNPDDFSSTLCKHDQLRCEEYQSGDGRTVNFFKDPGERICEYRTILGTSPARFAWFKKGDVDPGNANPPECTCERRDVDTNGNKAWFRIDDPFNTVDHSTCLAEFGNASTDTNEWVRSCPADQAGCTEFIQPLQCEFVAKNNQLDWYKVGTDRLNPEKCESYHYLNDNRLDESSCNGVVDWKNGCVLFNDTSNSALKFETGQDSNYQGGAIPCDPTSGNDCNTNRLLKVRRDRVCGEWLSCLSSRRVFDQNQGLYRDICYAVGTCTESKEGEVSECGRWSLDTNPQTLSEDFYQGRQIGWSGKEYSGWSIPKNYPISSLRQIPYGVDAEQRPNDYRLTYIEPNASAQSCRQDSDCAGIGNQKCFNGSCYDDRGLSDLSVTADQCLNNDGCDAPGTFCDTVAKRCVSVTNQGKSCRGYPELDSPFPSDTPGLAYYNTNPDADNFGKVKSTPQALKDANFGIWEEDVDCDYQKVEFTGGDEKYFSVNSFESLFRPYKDSGQLLTPQKVNRFSGWRGYCLETDGSRQVNNQQGDNACISWYPIDLIDGEVDIYNSSSAAGYSPDLANQYYCIESKLAEYRTTTSTFKADNQTQCNERCGLYNNSGYNRRFRWVTVDAGTRQFVRCTCYPSGGDGWYDFDGYEPQGSKEIHTEVCTAVARIADDTGIATAQTSNIYDVPGGFSVPEINFGIDQPNGVYGVMVAPPGVPHEDWTKQNGLNVDVTALPIPVVSRQTYSDCDGGYCDQNSNQCVGGPDNGKKCPLPSYQAGSPYSCNNALCPTRSAVKVKHQDPNLNGIEAYKHVFYTDGQDIFTDGINRLSSLFVKSYGVWDWDLGSNRCFGQCQGGVLNGAACLNDATCIIDVTEDAAVSDEVLPLPAQCATGTCTSGSKAGNACSSDGQCRDALDGICIAGACSHNGEPCGSNNECSELGTGSCVKASRCTAGNQVGQECTTNGDCGTGGVCAASIEGLCESTSPWIANRSCVLDSECEGYRSGSCNVTTNSCRGSGVKRGLACSNTADCETNGVCRGPLQCSNGLACNNLGGLCGGSESQGYNEKGCPGEGTSCNREGDGVFRCTGGSRAGQHCIAWDRTNQGAAPVIRQVQFDPAVRSFKEGEVGKFSVANKTTGDLLYFGGVSKGILATFYAYNADGQQMPLTEIVVDWGDGKQSFSKGSFKNHKHYCKLPGDTDDLGRGYNFGDTVEACVEDSESTIGHFSYVHVYSCIGPNDPAWVGAIGACEYNPIVSVTDNWDRSSSALYDGTIRVFVQP